MSLPLYMMPNAPTRDTMFVHTTSQGVIATWPSYILTDTNGTGWTAHLGSERSISSRTGRWPGDAPHPADWVAVGSEYRPQLWPQRFPLVEFSDDAKPESVKDYSSRMQADSLVEGTDGIKMTDWSDIYKDRLAEATRLREKQARDQEMRDRNAVNRQNTIARVLGIRA